MSFVKNLISGAGAVLVASSLAYAERTIRSPDVGQPENAPSSVYYEEDYFSYSDERLEQLDEASFWKLSKDPNLEAIRFFWVPEEGEVLLVRINIDKASDKAQMTFKRSTGVTETSWGTVAQSSTRELKAAELKDLRYQFDYMAYWRFETDNPDDFANSPGPLWLFEAIEGTKYHAAHRSNPTLGEAKRLGLLMLRFAELDETDVAWPRRPTAPKRPPIE